MKNIFSILLLIILTITSYLPAFKSDFVFDDHILVERNPSIRNLKNIPLFFTSKDARIPREFSDLQSDTYRPLQSISYTISYFLWGSDAGLFYAENVFVHLINGIILYFLILLIFKRRLLSFLAALLFLLHPVQVEAVTYLAGRCDVLALSFFLLSFYTCIRGMPPRSRSGFIFYLISLIFFAASLLSKEMAATLPFIIILYLLLCQSEKGKFSIAKIFKTAGPYFLVLIIFFIVRAHNLGKVAQEAPRGIFFILLTMTRVFVEYLRLLFFPVRLTFFHEINTQGVSPSPFYIFYIVIIAAFLYICRVAAKKNKPIAFLLFSYIVALLPVSNIIPIKTIMQERFLYFPSVFILTVVSYVLVKFWDNMGKSKIHIFKGIPLLLTAAVVATLAIITFNRNQDWRDEITLVEKELTLHPEDGKLYFDLGHTYFLKKEYEKAKSYFQKALQKRLSSLHRTMTYDELGNVYKMENNFNKAMEYYSKAIATTPAYAHSLNSLGDIYFKRQDYRNAKHYFKRAVEAWPESDLYNTNLGIAYIMLGDKKNALKYWKRSLAINPNQSHVREYILRNK